MLKDHVSDPAREEEKKMPAEDPRTFLQGSGTKGPECPDAQHFRFPIPKDILKVRGVEPKTSNIYWVLGRAPGVGVGGLHRISDMGLAGFMQ